MTASFAYLNKYALNAICPYFTMFPLEYPMRILEKHKNEDPIVLDPFCGRGTTLCAANSFGIPSYGFDTSPVAVAIAQAKLAQAPLGEVLELAQNLLEKPASNVPQSNFFRHAYAKKTLEEVCSIREGLLSLRKETGASVILRAAMLGCLHGPMAKNPKLSGYLSNQMPRTFASKPDYSIRYWKEKELKAPKLSAINVIRRKLQRIPDLDFPKASDARGVRLCDARQAKPYEAVPRPSLIITSPPYYGMRTYVQDQWLRAWFLGGPHEISYEASEQISHDGHDSFVSDLAHVWQHVRRRCTDGAHLYVRFGAIPSVKSDARKLLKDSLSEAGDWRLISVRNAKTASHGKRQSDQMTSSSEAATEFDFHATTN